MHELLIVLFGGTGDLSRKKLLPALFYLFEKGILSHFRIVSIARQQLTDLEYCQLLTDSFASEDTAKWQQFLERVTYVQGDSTQDAVYRRLKERFSDYHQSNRLFYLATLPHLYSSIASQLRTHGLTETASDEVWCRLLVEKPFGTDLASSRTLNNELLSAFPEKDIFRIDHYLAKETMQNIITFRFANGIFEHVWNSQYIDHIQITSAETLGIEGREQFYTGVGVVRDVIQNHVLSLLAIALMEEPASISAKAIQRERLRLLSQVEVLRDVEIRDRVRFGAYQNASNQTPTAAALRLSVQNPRWSGMPIYIRAGKKLAMNVTELSVVFKEPINQMFGRSDYRQPSNILTFRIQPNEGIILQVNVKRPGLEYGVDPAAMSFCYSSSFAGSQLPEAYSKVIYDAIKGDTTLFLDEQGVDASWAAIQPVLEYQDSGQALIETYQQSSWGPQSFDVLMERDGRKWLEPDLSVCSI